MHGVEPGAQPRGGQTFKQVAVHPLRLGAPISGGSQCQVQNHHLSGVPAGDQDRDVLLIGFWLGERVVQGGVDRVAQGFGGVDLGDDHPAGVSRQDVRHAQNTTS